ncbi:hypothetical protein FDP41_013568 [Naegleria fowleri]|uniref:Uncharacterized protein n=1 Tax=Naegleria fowleri TaxID=5763 RepID=A0A6A5C1A5_NAEFO|nr:uncharacterized protein FDP41_013568 [Naegleria fowleri]KAF0980354.1 hypothetical protein FDP41_013568 [Naegleria fowleri]CAG4719000.1 unnamed protein product [Naegleria fowleri]
MHTRSHDVKESSTHPEVRDMKHGYSAGDSSETLPGGRERGPREHFEEICADDNYEVASHHMNVRGDYTVVFRHKYGGKDQTFPNISREKIESCPSRIKSRILEK